MRTRGGMVFALIVSMAVLMQSKKGSLHPQGVSRCLNPSIVYLEGTEFRIDCKNRQGRPVRDQSIRYLFGAPMDLNRVTFEDLTKIDGIGPALAKRIIAFRRSRGRFENLDELLEVKGIGKKKLISLKRVLTVSKEHR